MNREIPTLLSTNYASNSFTGDSITFGNSQAQRSIQSNGALQQLIQRAQDMLPAPQQQEITMSAARIVKVFIADPNENIPLERRVIYTGDEKLTDLTDQELFFEVSIADLLTKHNIERIKVIDKTQASKFGRDIFLEAAKIRDLKMVVVTVATF